MHDRRFLKPAFIIPIALLIALFGAVFYWWDTVLTYNDPFIFFVLLSFVILFFSFVVHLRLKRREHRFHMDDAADRTIGLQLYEELFDNSPVPYMLVDHRGVIEVPNVAAVRIFGRPEYELKGENVFSLMTAEDPDHLALVPQKLEKGIYVNEEEVKIDRPDDSFRWAYLSAFPFRDGRHKKYNLVTLIDITRQKEIDQVKSEFVSLASHQLRTPISSLKWNVELLQSERSGTLSEKQLKYALKIERAAERMDALVGDFLNVSKLELGTLTPRAKQIEVDTFFESIYEEFQERIEKKEITLTKQYAEDITTIVADKRLFRMVITNLVSNAVKYTPEGGTVTVSYAGNEHWVTFSISDTGMGIPKNDQEQLFTKLFRAKNAREQVPEGTGLGLYVVKQAVEVMRGSISFKSQEGTGTTFEVVLPR